MAADRLAGIWGMAAAEAAVDGGEAQTGTCEVPATDWGVAGVVGKLVGVLITGEGVATVVAGTELEGDCMADDRGVEGRVCGRRRALLSTEAVFESMGTQTRE